MADNSVRPASTSQPRAPSAPPIPCKLPAPKNYALNLLNPFTAHTRMVKNYILMLTIFATLATEHKEAAWYGPWMIVLDLLFMDTHIMPNGVCYPIPQMSVSFDYDPAKCDEDEASDSDGGYNIDDGESRSDDDPFTDKRQTIEVNCGRLMARGLSPSPGRILSAAPIATPPSTPPNTSTLPRPSPIKKDHPPRSRRSTRVPDFCQIVQKIGHDGNGLLFQASRLILIVEIKSMAYKELNWVMRRTREQVISQADHAFKADKDLQELGCIIAVGHYWTYFECTRKDMSPFSTASEHDDPSYRADSSELASGSSASPSPSIPSSQADQPKTQYPAEFLRDIFQERPYLSLQDSQGLSNLAFSRIYERLKARIDAV